MSDLEIKKTYGLFDNPLNKKLIADLKRGGENVLTFPLMRTRQAKLSEAAAEIFENLDEFDWLILTDVLAADFFIEQLGARGLDFFVLDDLTTCALGEAVADRLRFVQVHADVIPSRLDHETIFAAVTNYAGGELNGLKFLVVTEKNADLIFAENLRAGEAAVEILPLYRAEFADEPAIAKLKTLLKGGAVDEFIFSMPEDLLSLKMLNAEADLAALLNETRLSAVSEIVFQTLQENGLRPLYFHYK